MSPWWHPSIRRVRFSFSAVTPATLSAPLLDFLVPLVGGLLVGLAFYIDDASPIVWVALVPTAWTLTRKTPTIALYCGCFYGGLLSSMLSLDWLRRSYEGQLVDSWILFSHLLAVYGIAAVGIGRQFARIARAPMLLVLPAFVVTAEEVRWRLAGILVGDGFPLLQLGITQAEHPQFAQLADLGGIPAVSCLIAISTGAIYDATRMRLLPAVCGVLLVAAAFLYGQWRLVQAVEWNGPTVGLVTGRLDIAHIGGLTDAIVKLSDSSAHEVAFPDLLIWKETAASLPLITREGVLDGSDNLVTSLTHTANRLKCSLLVGVVRRDYSADRYVKFNSVLYVAHPPSRFQYYDKVHLAPWTEFRPYLADGLGILPFPERRFKSLPFSRGSKQRVLSLKTARQDYRFAPTICYDVLFPSDHRRLMISGEAGVVPDCFVASADEMGSRMTSFSSMASKLQRFRAIETRRAYIRNAEHGISMIVDGSGQPIEIDVIQLPNNQTMSYAQIPVDTRTSIYVYCGEWIFVMACSFMALHFAPRFVLRIAACFNHS